MSLRGHGFGLMKDECHGMDHSSLEGHDLGCPKGNQGGMGCPKGDQGGMDSPSGDQGVLGHEQHPHGDKQGLDATHDGFGQHGRRS